MIHDKKLKIRYVHKDSPLCSLDEGPLTGLRHRTVIDGNTGANSLALWQEEHLPGFRVPLHHHDCEEIITILDGTVDAFLDDLHFTLGAGQSILIPPSINHGFEVIGDVPVRLLAIFSSSTPAIFKADGTRTQPPWEGGASDHLLSELSSDS